MQAQAEESKNAILERINREVDRVDSSVQAAFDRTTLVVIVVVMVLLILVAAFCQNWILIGLVVIYVLIMSFIYLQFTREFSRKRLGNASHTIKNFMASEKAIQILNDAGAVYVSTPA